RGPVLLGRGTRQGPYPAIVPEIESSKRGVRKSHRSHRLNLPLCGGGQGGGKDEGRGGVLPPSPSLPRKGGEGARLLSHQRQLQLPADRHRRGEQVGAELAPLDVEP